jgi:DNA-binding CsgD family transcriptional regulator
VWPSPQLAHELLESIADGSSDYEISDRLDIPVETVRDAIRSLAAVLPR